jgi:pyruvate/2-oxoglutarate dehydrogenase complex dihydrolipoamide acyltransferase (E2) component
MCAPATTPTKWCRTVTRIEVPDLGAPATFGQWHVRAGDRVREGDRVAEVLIAGAAIDVSAPVSGALVGRAAHPGDALPPGTVIGTIQDEEC